jgi:diacylglycerol kinase (ATP)
MEMCVDIRRAAYWQAGWIESGNRSILPTEKTVTMIRARLRSFQYAFQGIHTLFATQPNAWIHLTVAIAAVFLGFWLRISPLEWCLIIFSIGLVLAAEAMNTALEFLTDLASPRYHELAGKAKDSAAGAVLISACTAILIGSLIFLPKLLHLLK